MNKISNFKQKIYNIFGYMIFVYFLIRAFVKISVHTNKDKLKKIVYFIRKWF